jgi:hypothetical protein
MGRFISGDTEENREETFVPEAGLSDPILEYDQPETARPSFDKNVMPNGLEF